METAKIKASKAKAEEIMDFYGVSPIEDPKRPYDLFQTVTPDGVVVKGYRTKNPDVFTVCFSGGKEKTMMEASVFEREADKIAVQDPSRFDDIQEQIGSDEVGVGDFFGPMVVTAAYFLPGEMEVLKDLDVRDSKKLTDAHMLAIGKSLCRSIKHFTAAVSAKKLSDYVDQGYSNHWVLARLHDLAQRSLKAKYDIPDDVTVFVDQFEPEPLYRKHCGSGIIDNPIIFKTKGETHFPSVACASVIARYEFLKAWEKMEKDLGTPIPKGAGAEVDKAYLRAVAINGKAKVNKYVKRFFRNYKDQNPSN